MIHIADVVLTLNQIGQDAVDYHQYMHMRGGHEANGSFERWKNNRRLYQTGNLYRSYMYKLSNFSLDGGSVTIMNKAPYSPFLEEKGYPHIYKSEHIDDVVEIRMDELMRSLIMD